MVVCDPITIQKLLESWQLRGIEEAASMDDLLDLDWQRSSSSGGGGGIGTSSNAQTSKVASSAGTAHSSNPSRSGTPAYSSYSFDALTRSMPSSSASTPKMHTATPSSVLPPSARPTAAKSAAPAASSSSNDAFSSLLSFGGSEASSARMGSSLAPSMASMSLSHRQSGSPVSSLPQPVQSSQSDAWTGMTGWDDFEASKSSSANSGKDQSQRGSLKAGKTLLDSFDSASSTTAPAAKHSAPSSSLPMPSSKGSQPRSQSRSAANSDPFDFSDFEDPATKQTSALGGSAMGDTPMLTQEADESDDILGILGKPAQPRPPVHEGSSAKHPNTSASKHQGNGRSVSPPPHLLGQIVEMGFSPLEAREALAQTGTGLDADAAIESLLAAQRDQQASADHAYATRLQREESGHPEVDTEMEQYEAREKQRTAARWKQLGANAPSASSSGRASPSKAQRRAVDSPASDTTEWQKQADQLYSQASEIGASVFSKANAFWSSAKAQAQKTIEEQRQHFDSANNSGRSSPATDAARQWTRRWGSAATSRDVSEKRDARPRWMVEAEAGEATESTASAPSQIAPTAVGGFRDSDEEDRPAASFVPQEMTSARASKASVHAKPISDTLWGNSESSTSATIQSPVRSETTAAPVTGYVSSARWGRARNAVPSTAAKPNRVMASVSALKRSRTILPEDLAAAEKSGAHKLRGNEAFKKGDYGLAEASYTAALQSLSDQSLRRIPLLNNRANARMKNGDAAAASHDCSMVIRLIVLSPSGSEGSIYEPSKEEALPTPIIQEVNLRDAYSKALSRRASASEMLEKWLPALKDWTLLERYEKEEGSGAAVGFRNLKSAQDGIRRCKGMISGKGGKDGPSSSSPAPPRPTISSRSRTAPASSAAVSKAEAEGRARVQASLAAQSAEEAAAHALKDTVDTKVNGWKAGKEGNIRALLCSLDSVVWDSLGWKKVGMHEVLTEPQVKKAYTKAMVKLHPDKLTPKNTSLEQRLVANAVFATLNEAFVSSSK